MDADESRRIKRLLELGERHSDEVLSLERGDLRIIVRTCDTDDRIHIDRLDLVAASNEIAREARPGLFAAFGDDECHFRAWRAAISERRDDPIGRRVLKQLPDRCSDWKWLHVELDHGIGIHRAQEDDQKPIAQQCIGTAKNKMSPDLDRQSPADQPSADSFVGH
jgi:hypothetical protein